MRRIVAIAAPVGGGKSSLSQVLARVLGGAPIVYFDDFELATQRSVAELEGWLADGADFNTLPAPGLVERLERLRHDAGQSDWLVFEMPLGREYAATANAIDVLVWLDVPLDVAVARKLRELAAAARVGPETDLRPALHWIDDYLGFYISTIRKVLLAQRDRVPVRADLVLDGCADPERLASQVLEHIQART